MHRNKTAKRRSERRVVNDLTVVLVVFVSLRLFYRFNSLAWAACPGLEPRIVIALHVLHLAHGQFVFGTGRQNEINTLRLVLDNHEVDAPRNRETGLGQRLVRVVDQTRFELLVRPSFGDDAAPRGLRFRCECDLCCCHDFYFLLVRMFGLKVAISTQRRGVAAPFLRCDRPTAADRRSKPSRNRPAPPIAGLRREARPSLQARPRRVSHPRWSRYARANSASRARPRGAPL